MFPNPIPIKNRHFDLYLKPIKAAILESAAAKEILDMRGDDEDFDDEVDGGFDHSKGEDAAGGRGARGSIGADGRVEGDSDSKGRGGAGKVARTGFRSYATGGRRRKRLASFRVSMAAIYLFLYSRALSCLVGDSQFPVSPQYQCVRVGLKLMHADMGCILNVRKCAAKRSHGGIVQRCQLDTGPPGDDCLAAARERRDGRQCVFCSNDLSIAHPRYSSE